MDALTQDGSDIKRLVVKIGSALLIDDDTASIRSSWLTSLCADIAALKAKGTEVVIVSSGAVAVGRPALGLTGRPLKLEEKQAAAATGQIRLAHAYQKEMASFDIPVAQILLTLADSEDRRRYLNARTTLETLLSLGSVPVINENDTVTTEEIRFGDNDRLAARVAEMLSADALILFSDIDGLYTADPHKVPEAAHIPTVSAMTPEIEAMGGDSAKAHGSGGMLTKLMAGRICMNAGCKMAITRGEMMNPVASLFQGGKATWFLPAASPKTAFKRFIGGSLKPTGAFHLDRGAEKALRTGNSLLPIGVTEITGHFSRGDAVEILNADGQKIGQGLTAYNHMDAAHIIGHHSTEIAAILGFEGREELIHRDNLVFEGDKG